MALSEASVSPLALYEFLRPVSQAVSEAFMFWRIGREKPKYWPTFFAAGERSSRRASACRGDDNGVVMARETVLMFPIVSH